MVLLSKWLTWFGNVFDFMPVKTFRPLTPSTRYITYADYSDITKTKPEKSLVEIRKKTGGRNHYGRVHRARHWRRPQTENPHRRFQTQQARRRSDGHGASNTIRAAPLAWLCSNIRMAKRLTSSLPIGLQVGAKLMSGPTAPPELGNCLPLTHRSRRAADS